VKTLWSHSPGLDPGRERVLVPVPVPVLAPVVLEREQALERARPRRYHSGGATKTRHHRIRLAQIAPQVRQSCLAQHSCSISLRFARGWRRGESHQPSRGFVGESMSALSAKTDSWLST
jgi:hypothetical protein